MLEREWHPSQRGRKRRNGDVEFTLTTTGLFEVMRWVLSWGRAAKVLGPAALRKGVEEEVRKIWAATCDSYHTPRRAFGQGPVAQHGGVQTGRGNAGGGRTARSPKIKGWPAPRDRLASTLGLLH